MNYFIFIKNGKYYDSRDYEIGCGGFPPIVIPKERTTIESVPGRDGSLVSTDHCYDSYTKNIECYMPDDVYKDLSWLSGSGKLILSNELNRIYDVRLKNNIELEQIAIYWRNFILKFEVQPFKKGCENHILNHEEKDFSFEIGGNTRSLPTISVTGTGNIDITVNEETFKIINLETTIVIDSELQVAFENQINALPKMNGEFPKLQPGINTFHIVGDLSNIIIEYQDTYL